MANGDLKKISFQEDTSLNSTFLNRKITSIYKIISKIVNMTTESINDWNPAIKICNDVNEIITQYWILFFKMANTINIANKKRITCAKMEGDRKKSEMPIAL